MPWTTGSYAESDRPATVRSRWFWFRSHLIGAWLAHRRHPEDTGGGSTFRREWGGWAVRPSQGWRRFRWITPPTLYTRRFSSDQHDAAADWMLERMGLPH